LLNDKTPNTFQERNKELLTPKGLVQGGGGPIVLDK